MPIANSVCASKFCEEVVLNKLCLPKYAIDDTYKCK